MNLMGSCLDKFFFVVFCLLLLLFQMDGKLKRRNCNQNNVPGIRSRIYVQLLYSCHKTQNGCKVKGAIGKKVVLYKGLKINVMFV